MDESGDYDGVVREIPYEEAQAALDGELELLHGIASSLLREKYEEKGDGWQYEEARFHMWKGIDELFSATHYVDEGDLDAFERHVGHGLNHILMASFVSEGAEDLIQRKASRAPTPSMSEVEVEEDDDENEEPTDK